MKRFLVACGFAVLAMVVITGCGRSKTTPQSTAGQATKATGTTTTIRFLAMEYDTNTRPFMAEFKKEFEAANPGIKLEIEVVDWDSGHQKLSTLVNANNPPDLANIATLWIAEYVDLDALEPLGTRLGKKFMARFDPLTFHGARYQGHIYGLPIAVSARALYCNKDILDAHGLKPPKTWQQLLTVAQKCTDPKHGVYGFGLQGAKVETDVYWYYFLWNNGGEILSPDEKKAVFNSPAGVEALQYCCDLANKYKVTEPNPTAYNREDLQDMFKSGKLAMMITGPWFWHMLNTGAPNLHYEIVPIPTNTNKQVTMAVTDNLVMFKACKNKAAAQKVIEFFYQPKFREKWAKTFYMLPALKSVQQAPFIKQSKQWSAFINLLPSGRFVPLNPRWTTMAADITTAIQAAYLGKAPRQALDEAAQQVQKLLDQK